MSPAGSAPVNPSRDPVSVDTTRPSVARMYDYSLGGKDNFQIDRDIYQQVLHVAPHTGDLARDNRQWLQRAVRYMASIAGMTQFLDIGAGLPTAYNTHDVAQEGNPTAAVVYVDNDPVCAAHGRAILEDNPHTHFVASDITTPDDLLAKARDSQMLDFSAPLGLIFSGILHHLDDGMDPGGLARYYIDQLAPGSYVAISHFWNPNDGSELADLASSIQHVTNTKLGTAFWRTTEEITSYFAGLSLVEPGLVELHSWWPNGPQKQPLTPEQHLIVGAVGYKSA